MVRQQTGSPTGGTLFGITVNDNDVLPFAVNDGTSNVVTISRTGVITAAGLVLTNSYWTFQEIANPGTPASGFVNFYMSSTCSAPGWTDDAGGVYCNARGDSSGNALTGDSATAFFSSGTIEVARGGTGAAPGADDQVIVADSTSGATWRGLPNGIVSYATSSNTFSAAAIPLVVFNPGMGIAPSTATDGATDYIMLAAVLTGDTGTSSRRWAAPMDFTVTAMRVTTACGTAGGTETVTFTLRDDATDTSLTGTGAWDATETSYEFTGSVSVAKGSYLSVKAVYPNPWTNPATCRPHVTLMGTIP